MGRTDEFGNYVLTLNNIEYRINKPDWREKRVLRGKMSKVLTPEGELDPFSDGFYDLQDWVMSKISYVNGEAMTYLKDSLIIASHFESLGVEPLDGVDQLFNEAIAYLAENFTSPAAEQSDPQNLPADAGDSSKVPNTQQQQSAMLRR